jgi:glutaconate CoA-transferase subunit A
MPPTHGLDMAWFKKYAGAAKDPGDWAAVSDELVGESEEAYLASVGGKEAVRALPLPIY